MRLPRSTSFARLIGVATYRLLPDPQPLVERLGREFFRSAPTAPGVYLMRDAQHTVVYVGKARNLRQRLNSYRVANAERLPKRLLRLLHSVHTIELELCADEARALAREAELLRELKPKFNRAGVWPGKPRFLAWCNRNGTLELTIQNEPVEGWQVYGPLGSQVVCLKGVLVRWLWVTLHPAGLTTLPIGWFHGHLPKVVTLPDPDGVTADYLSQLFAGELEQLDIPVTMCRFTQQSLATDQEWLSELLRKPLPSADNSPPSMVSS